MIWDYVSTDTFINNPVIKGSFSRDASLALYEFLDSSEDVLLDPIDIRCSFAEYASAAECIADHKATLADCETWSDIENYTLVLRTDAGGAVIYRL